MSDPHIATRPGPVAVSLRPERILGSWIALTVVLAVLSSAELLLRRSFQDAFSTSDLFFYLDTEGNLPVWVSCFGLAAIGALAALIARSPRPDRSTTRAWVLVAVGFFVLSIDEMCQYHEHLTEPIWTWLEARNLTMDGYVRNAWVVPVLVLSPIVMAACVPFLRALDAPTRSRLIRAGAVYFSGAVGMDMVSGREFHQAQGFSMTLLALVTVEEVLELLGQGLFLHALAAYLAARRTAVRFEADAT